jgi:hypothetical protein
MHQGWPACRLWEGEVGGFQEDEDEEFEGSGSAERLEYEDRGPVESSAEPIRGRQSK